VCPKSVLGNWVAEATRFAPSLKVHVHHGPDRASRVSGFDEADVVLTTYPLLTRDEELFAGRKFATVVLDEAQTIKSAGSTFTHAACALSAEFRLALSGTPMENPLGELWSVMRFTLPELLGEARTFARAFRRPIERDGSAGARQELVRRLAPFLLRRRQDQVASELPPKTVIVEAVDLEDAQRDVYETVRAAMDVRVRQALAERGIAQSHIIVLDALLKLRQAVCDPRLLPAKTARTAGSAKLDVLVAMLTQLVREGRRTLVFSQFVTMLELVQKELRREKIPFVVLTGQTENRTKVVEAFQSGAAPVFLLSLKAGGTGLNLTAADVVIHYDPWWNPAAEAQATDRAHRIGQDKPVLVYKLVGKGTIEEKILALQEKKQALFASVLDDGAGAAKALTAADVAFLFS
jgi:SNF2 family DNA or RNA helicase